MPTRKATAEWQGDLATGKGTFKGQSGAIGGAYSFKTRFEEAPGTNPEELIGAAHASCFSMALSHMLASAGHVPASVKTESAVTIENLKISKIKLTTEGKVPGIDAATFKEFAEKAKAGCPVSVALSAVPIELETKFV